MICNCCGKEFEHISLEHNISLRKATCIERDLSFGSSDDSFTFTLYLCEECNDKLIEWMDRNKKKPINHYKVSWNSDINSYTIKVINSSELTKNDENTYSNLEDAEKKLKELQTGEIPHKTSPKEFEEKMLDAIKRADGSPEEYHGDMDWIMCNLLRELGYGKGVDVFQSVEKWYA